MARVMAEFDEEPNYGFLVSLFEDLFRNQGYTDMDQLQWKEGFEDLQNAQQRHTASRGIVGTTRGIK
jgi:hypothetical protein